MSAGATVRSADRVPLLNAANGLTALRLLLVPVFVTLVVVSGLEAPGWRAAACLTFVAASFTDFADGWIARRYRLVTPFGKIADPIADKALTGAALVLLSAYGRCPGGSPRSCWSASGASPRCGSG